MKGEVTPMALEPVMARTMAVLRAGGRPEWVSHSHVAARAWSHDRQAFREAVEALEAGGLIETRLGPTLANGQRTTYYRYREEGTGQ